MDICGGDKTLLPNVWSEARLVGSARGPVRCPGMVIVRSGGSGKASALGCCMNIGGAAGE